MSSPSWLLGSGKVVRSVRAYVYGNDTFITYHFDHAGYTVRDGHFGLFQTQRLSARIAHICLDPALFTRQTRPQNPQQRNEQQLTQGPGGTPSSWDSQSGS